MSDLTPGVLIPSSGGVTVTVNLNGQPRSAPAEPRLLLSDFLRHVLGATGTHVGCEQGGCGACTVRLDGEAVLSCLTLAVQADGRRVDTVEGLAHHDQLCDLQASFRKHGAVQCGFCTPGLLMALDHYLEAVPSPTEAELKEMLAGHLCRCTGYTPIVESALEVAATRRRLAIQDADEADRQMEEPLTEAGEPSPGDDASSAV